MLLKKETSMKTVTDLQNPKGTAVKMRSSHKVSQKRGSMMSQGGRCSSARIARRLAKKGKAR